MRPPATDISAPEFPDQLEWLNGPSRHMAAELGGRAVLVAFWDLSHLASLRTLDYLREWNRRYADLGLTVVGVHSPRYSFGADPAVVGDTVRRLGIDFPIAADVAFEVWRAYENPGWPARYLWDSRGLLRDFHFGEGEYLAAEQSIQEVLAGIDSGVELPSPMAPLRATDAPGARCIAPTPELPLGQAPGEVEVPVAHRGQWRLGEEHAEALEPGATLAVDYAGAGAHGVLAPPDRGDTALVEVFLDGRQLPAVELDAPRLYTLAEHDEHERHRLELRFAQPGSRAYSVAFSPAVVPGDR